MTAYLHVHRVHQDVAEDVQNDRPYCLDSEIFVIGRLPSSHIPVNHSRASRQHAQITREARGYFLSDLDSLNGTYLNGEWISAHSAKLLRSEDLIQVADLLVLRFEDPSMTVPVSTATPHLSMQFMLDSDKQQVFVRGQGLDPKLPSQQFRLLTVLVECSGDIVERDRIADVVWPEARGGVSEAMIDNTVARIRKRLAEIDRVHVFIETVRGVGYRFRMPG